MRYEIALLAFLILLVAGCSSSGSSGFRAPVDISSSPPVDAFLIGAPSCTFCTDLSTVLNDLELNGEVTFGEVKTLDFAGKEAADLIAKLNITRVPVLLLSEEIASYPQLAVALTDAGQEPVNGFYVLHAPPVYVDLSSGEMRGAVNVTLVSDASCTECFDPHLMRSLVERFGVAIVSERIVDVSSENGRAIVSRYNITGAPTIVLTGDLKVYANFNEAWRPVGSIEKDGAYVFRNLVALGSTAVYKNLTTGKIVRNK